MSKRDYLVAKPHGVHGQEGDFINLGIASVTTAKVITQEKGLDWDSKVLARFNLKQAKLGKIKECENVKNPVKTGERRV